MEPGKDLHLVMGRLILPDLEAILYADEMERKLLLDNGGRKYPSIAGGATPKWYATAINKIMKGTLDLSAGTIKLELVTTTRAPVQATDATTSDLGANEASGGSGYTAGGFTLASLGVTQATLVNNWDAADLSPACHITGGPFAFRYGIFYKTTDLIGYVDFGSQSVTDADINITLTNQLTITAS